MPISRMVTGSAQLWETLVNVNTAATAIVRRGPLLSWNSVPPAAVASRSIAFDPYIPLFRHSDLNTILGPYWPVRLEPGEPRLFATEPDVQVLARCHWHNPSAPVLVLAHGLEGSCEATYMRAMARAAIDAGFDVVRLNTRNCGGTEHLAPTLYHSGLTIDLRSIVEQLAPRRVFLVGFSLGGNQALKLAGEWGDHAPPHVAGVCAISAPIDLAASAQALGEPRNGIYERRFMRSLRRRLRLKAQLWPGRYSVAAMEGVRSIVGFDDAVTAPAFGFRDGPDYYEQSSARRFLPLVQVPSLLIQAQDDPFFPFERFRVPDNAALHVLTPEHGGHVAFLSKTPPRFWASQQVIRFCQAYA